MTERYAFWKGVVAGIFGGIAVGALTRLSAAEASRLRDDSATPRPRDTHVDGGNRYRPNSAPRLRLRRDDAESAGDPRMTAPVRTPDAVTGRAFERPPGAPGGQTPAEVLAAPGRPGRYMDHGIHQRRKTEDQEALPVA